MNGKRFAELEVMNFFLETVDALFKVADNLHGHWVAAFGGLSAEFRQSYRAHLVEFLFARANVNLQVFEVVEIFLIERVEHDDIFHHLDFGIF